MTAAFPFDNSRQAACIPSKDIQQSRIDKEQTGWLDNDPYLPHSLPMDTHGHNKVEAFHSFREVSESPAEVFPWPTQDSLAGCGQDDLNREKSCFYFSAKTASRKPSGICAA